MSLEKFSNPEKKSFFDKHKAVVDEMKAIGTGVAGGVLGAALLEIINQSFGLGMPPEFIDSMAVAGSWGGIAIGLYDLKNKKKK